VPYDDPVTPTVYVDSATGTQLTSYVPPTLNATLEALEIFLNQTSKYNYLMLPGYWDFPNGSAIPSDLLLPFGQYARKYGIEAAAPIMETISNVGVGGLENILTLWVMQAFPAPVNQEFLTASLFVPKDASNSILYDRALQLLQQDVLLSSMVVTAERNDSGVQLVVQCAGGSKKLIKAKRMIFTPPPSLGNLAVFAPDGQETSAFSTWTDTWSFAAVARIPAIPANYSANWIAPAGAPTNYLDTRNWPWTLSTSPAPGDIGLSEVLLASNYSLTHAQAKATIESAIQEATSAGGAFPNGTAEVEFVAFVDHNSIRVIGRLGIPAACGHRTIRALCGRLQTQCCLGC